MSDSETSPFLKSIFGLFKETAGYVPVAIAFILAMLGLAPGDYPVTTATLTFLILSLLLLGWRLPQITRQKPALSAGGLFVVGETRKHIPFWRSLLDPLRTYSIRTYSFSPFRRRLEFIIISAVLLTASFQTVTKFPWMQNELLGLENCHGTNRREALFVLLVDFNESGIQPEIRIVDYLHDFLSSNLDDKNFKVCRSTEPVSLRVDALQLAERTHADIIIWGRRNVVYDVHIEVPNWDPTGRDVSYRPSEETADFNFIKFETAHLGYLTEFILAEILFEAGKVEVAQQKIESAVARGAAEGLETGNLQDLSEGYFLKGILYDPGTFTTQENPNPNPKKAIEAYSESIRLNPKQYAALLNRGILHTMEGDFQNAMMDYTTLLMDESIPPLLAAAVYINRSDLQPSRELAESDLAEAVRLNPSEGYFFRGIARWQSWNDPQGAIEDFNQAILLNPDEFFYYHLLGQVQLEADLTEDAIQTYRGVIPHLNKETRENVISDLERLADSLPDSRNAIEQIIKELKSARVKK